MSRVSFDFDGTLGDNYKIRLFARELVSQGHEVWIVTARFANIADYGSDFARKYNIRDISGQHQELFTVAKWAGITEDHIHFCNMAPKAEFFLKQQDMSSQFLWHLDDDMEEINEINASTSTIGISCVKGPNWRLKCMELIKKDNG